MRAADPHERYVLAAIEGDDAALAHLVRATQPAVWRLCAALGSQGTTEDLVQETYLRALPALRRFRGEVPVQAWLLAIARHVCADDVRRRRRARRLGARLDGLATEAASPEPESIGDLLDDLQPDRREAFVLTQVLGLAYHEAADVMGCPVGTVRSRVARARRDLAVVVIEAEAR